MEQRSGSSGERSMRNRLSRILIALVCFGLGVGAAMAVDIFERVYFSYEPISVLGAGHSSQHSEFRRFTPTYRRVCPAYAQGFKAPDGERVSEGVSPVDNPFGQGYRQRILEGSTLVYVREYHGHRGVLGERYILQNPPNEQGETSVSILFYSGRDHYRFINAPTKDLALEFEQFLISTDYQESTK